MPTRRRFVFLAETLAIAAMLVAWPGRPARAMSIGRANIDGTGVNTEFIKHLYNPLALAVDNTSIYWADLSWSIGRANLDGSGADTRFIAGVNGTNINGPDAPEGVAVDGSYVYWTNSSCCQVGEPSSPGIGRANLDGTGVNESFIPLSGNNIYPTGVAVDGSYIYWTTGVGGTIGRANLDGTGVDESFITGMNAPTGIAVDGSYIYWADANANSIGRANLDGTGVDQSFITGGDHPDGLAIDATHIYWTNQFGDTIGRANLDGTAVDQSFITAGPQMYGPHPTGLAVGGGYIYWSPASVPEPAPALLLLAGTLGLAVRRRCASA